MLGRIEQPSSDTQAPAAPMGVTNELDKFLALPIADMDTDILEWWAEHESQLPNLSKMARQYLGCPATSASAERVFSLAGRIYGDLNQGMSPENLEERMWAKINRG